MGIPFGIVIGIIRYISKGIIDWEYILFKFYAYL